MWTLPKYTAGTVSVVQNSNTINGSGTAWISPTGVHAIAAGNQIRIGNYVGLITQVVSATQISVVPPWPNAGASGQAYEVYVAASGESTLIQGALQDLLGRTNGSVPTLRTTIDSGAMRAAWRDDGAGNFSGFVGNTGAADGSMTEFMEVVRTDGRLGFGAAATSGNRATFGGPLLVNQGLRIGVNTDSGAIQVPLDDSVGRNLDFDFTGVSTAVASIRLFRSTNTTGANALQFFRGDNSLTIDHNISGGSSGTVASFARNGGNVMIGSVATAGANLHVDSTGNTTLRVSSSFSGSTTTGMTVDTVGDTAIGRFNFSKSGTTRGSFLFRHAATGAAEIFGIGVAGGADKLQVMGSGVVRPGADNTQSLGEGSFRWSVVFAGTGTINTSDARQKTKLRPLTDAECAAARDLHGRIGVYQWLDSVAEKGEAGARLHVGLIAQEVEAVMRSHGLDPWRYGFLCRDPITRKVKRTVTRETQKIDLVDESYTEIEIRDGQPVQVAKTRQIERPATEMVSVVDEAGKPVMIEEDGEAQPLMHAVPIMEAREVEIEVDEPAGDRLGLRYEQLAMFILAGLHQPICSDMAAANGVNGLALTGNRFTPQPGPQPATKKAK